jgi:biopolymer transport protein ExbB/TolQ
VWNSLVTLIQGEVITFIVKGGLIMIPLLAASLIAVTVIVERFFFWRSLRVHKIDSAILTLVAEGDFTQAMAVASTSRHPVAQVLLAGLRSRDVAPGTAMQAGAICLRSIRSSPWHPSWVCWEPLPA